MRRFLYLLALNAFAILQPALDQLSSNPQYLILENFRLTEVIIVVLLLAGGLPGLQLTAVVLLERCGRGRLADRVMNLWLASGGALFGLVLGRWIASVINAAEIGIPQSLFALLAVPVAIVVPSLCRRSVAFQQLLALCAAGTLLFPLSLLTVPAVRYQLLGQELSAKAPPGHVGNPVPVVMIVFDGLNGMSLLQPDRQLNRKWFPGFARLADMSTFYRNTTTVHTRTDHAVPAMLTSTIPHERLQPVEADYPTGLFRLIFDSRQYQMSVFEPLTRMSPTELRQLLHQRNSAAQVMRLLSTLLRVCIHVALPQELPLQPAIPREWFGLVPLLNAGPKPMKGQIIYGWDEKRSMQGEHFISSLKTAAQPAFHFLHIGLPHYPWSLLPSGEPYVAAGTVGSAIYGLNGEIWDADEWPVKQAWHRNLMQIQYADKLVGQILDVLEETSLLKQTLLIVTSDHGMCFVPGHSLRDPTPDTLADLLPVPLFVKLPGQSTGTISDRNAETIDILPTIADVLRMQSDPLWAGSSLLAASPKPRKTIRGVFDTVLEPDFPARFDHTRRMYQALGESAGESHIAAPQTLPHLVGKPLSDFVLTSNVLAYESRVIPAAVAPVLYPPKAIPSEPFKPCLIQGRLTGAIPKDAVWLAVAAGGRILATTRTSSEQGFREKWVAWIEPELLPMAETPLEIYQVEDPETSIRLSRIPIRAGINFQEQWEPDTLYRND
ncbi:MAG: sulfatase-like hydrolase/transferase [Planctomycetaceae bacterium]